MLSLRAPTKLLLRCPCFKNSFQLARSRLEFENAKLHRLGGPRLLSRPLGRNYSTRVPGWKELSLSRLPINLATGLWVVVCGSLVYYVWRKRSASKAKLAAQSADQLREFTGKAVLITGAAGDIGSATATVFAERGATLILVDLPSMKDCLEQKCKELESQGASQVFFTTADVTNSDEVEQMADFAIKKAGRIDYFFNNAGIQGELRPLHKQSDDSFRKVMLVNTYGVFLGMKYVSKAMMQAERGGVIVNTASLAGLQGPPNMVAYAASKFAVIGMTKTAAKDLAPYGIRVCAIAPGLLEGRMWHSQVKGQAECRKHSTGDNTEVTDEEMKLMEETMIGGTPLQRLGKLSEVASVVVFLCSEEASYLSGIAVPIDGGRLP